jgi:hypothetical protein
MTYVQYYEPKLDGTLGEACGDRGVVILDGRNSIATMKLDARRFNGYRRPVYEAFAIFSGPSFTRSTAITPIIPL